MFATDALGWLYLLWQLVRPRDADPPGLGMSWCDAVKMGPVQARFVLLSHTQIKQMSVKSRNLRLEGVGVKRETVVERVRASVKNYMADLREYFTGERAEPKRVTPKYRERNRGRKGNPRSRRS